MVSSKYTYNLLLAQPAKVLYHRKQSSLLLISTIESKINQLVDKTSVHPPVHRITHLIHQPLHPTMSLRPLMWLVLAVLLLNAVYIISTTMRFPSFEDDNNSLEFDTEDAHVSTDYVSHDSLIHEPKSKDEHTTNEVLKETNETSNKEVSDGAKTNTAPHSPPQTTEDTETMGSSTNFTRYEDVVIVTKSSPCFPPLSSFSPSASPPSNSPSLGLSDVSGLLWFG